MNKEEFIKKLRKKIDILQDSEIEDIISEYEGYIEEKINRGLTEEEAVKELGDVNEIAKDLLEAYKVKQQKEESAGNKFFTNIANAINAFMDDLSEKSAKDILRIIIEVCIILLLIGLLKIPFEIIGGLGNDIFSSVGVIGDYFGYIWEFLLDVSYIVVAVIFFIKIIQKRYFKGISARIIDEKNDEEEPTPEEKVEKPTKKKAKKETANETIPKETKVKRKRERTFLDSLVDLGMLFIKFIVIMVLIGIVFYLIGMAVAIGFMIYFLIKGVTYYGVFILLLALFIGGIWFLEIGIKFILNKRISAMGFIVKIISIIVLMGVGLSFSAIEVSNTEIIYDQHYNNTKTISTTLEWKDGIRIYNYDKIIIDDTLGNKIKVEYTYPDFNNQIKMEIDIEKRHNTYHLGTNVICAKWNKALLDSVIKTLKDKKIYVADYKLEKTIYVSEEVFYKIKGQHDYDHDDDEIYTLKETYTVLNITESNDEAYLYLTLRQFQGEEVETVRVLRSVAKDVEENKSYEFTFKVDEDYYEYYDGENIKELFRSYDLIMIKEAENKE